MNNRKSEKSSFIKEIIGCLTSPRSSFKSILKKPSLMKATAIILVIAIVAAWAGFNYMAKLPPTRPPEQQPRQGTQAPVIITLGTVFISGFATWLISSALIHSFSKALGGEGTFRSVLTLAGYASTPLLIQQILRLADSLMISREALQLVTDLQISTSPIVNNIADAAIDTFTIFRLWSICLLIIATRENYEISTAKSTISTVLSFTVMVFVSAFLPFV